MDHCCSTDRSNIAEKINQFIYSPFNIIALAIIAIITFIFSFELIFYCIVILYSLYVISFCPDLAPLMPLFALCYVTVSKSNNPGITDQGIFYGKSAKFILCILSVAIFALIFRISLDKKIGWKLFITKRRSLLPGMLILSFAYLISGIGSEHYFIYVKGNFIFALIQSLSLFLLYFLFSATIQWERFNTDYFAYIGADVPELGADSNVNIIPESDYINDTYENINDTSKFYQDEDGNWWASYEEYLAYMQQQSRIVK